LLAGCGSSKDSKPVSIGGGTGQTTDDAPQSTTPVNEAPAPLPTPTLPSHENRSQDRSGGLQPGSDFQTDLDQTQQRPQQPSNSGAQNDQLSPGSSNWLRPNVPMATEKYPRVSQLQFNEVEAVKTGFQLDNLHYTSSGRDGLMTEFKSYNGKVSAAQKEMNLNLAKGIKLAKITRQLQDGSIVIDLTVDEFSKLKTYKMKATESEGQYKLTLISKTGDLDFQGGFLKCIDLDSGCENSYAKLKFSGAYARVIFRNSFADRHFFLPKENTSVGFNLWKTYVSNTINRVDTDQRLDFVQVSSFEVVNGRSGMGLVLLTQDKDLVGLSIPLVAPEKGTVVNASVTKLSDLSKSYDLQLANTYTQKLSQTIKSVKLVRNNGLGDIRLEMDVTDLNTTGPKSTIWMNVSKVNKATMSVADVQLFEKTLKSF